MLFNLHSSTNVIGRKYGKYYDNVYLYVILHVLITS